MSRSRASRPQSFVTADGDFQEVDMQSIFESEANLSVRTAVDDGDDADMRR